MILNNYLLEANGGALRPGVVVQCKGHLAPGGDRVGAMLCNAGVEVTDGADVRFTTARHCWESEVEKVVYYGDTAVAKIEERRDDDITW